MPSAPADLATSLGAAADELPALTRRLLAAGPGRKIHARMESELLFAPDVMAGRNAATIAKLSAEIGPGFEKTEAAQLLALGSVLETDAMAAVLIQVLERQWTTDAAELMPELASLWNPSAMDQTYHDLFATTFVAAGFENEEERRRVNVLATAYLVALVTDLALAHPSAG